MSAKKRRRHAGGKKVNPSQQEHCSVCGKPVTPEESLVVRTVVHCLDANCRPDLTPPKKATDEPGPVQPPADRSVRRLIVHTSLTIALCAVVLAMWGFRKMTHLRKENRILRSSRSALIEQLKANNREHSDTMPSVSRIQPPAALSRPIAPHVRKPAVSTAPSSTIPHHFVNGPVTSRTVAFTFDGGSLANIAGQILDTLRSRTVPATMFLTGHFIRAYPEITRRIVAEGHVCGNHTLSHPHLTSYAIDRTNTTLSDMTALRLRKQLQTAEALFLQTTGVPFAPLWRSPYGEFNRDICRWAREAGYLHVGWRQGRTWLLGLDSNDWVPDSTTPGFHTPAAFFDKVVHLARLQPHGINGGIILMHLGTERKNPAMQVHTVLGTLIDTLRAEGYRFVQIPEMAAASGIDLAAISQKAPYP